MDALLSFLKHASALDLLIVLLIVLLTVMLVVATAVVLFVARRPTALYVLLIIAVLPLLLGVLGTFLGNARIESALRDAPEAGAEVVAAARQEAWMPTYLGLAGTVVVEIITASGLVLKKRSGT